MEVCIMAEFFIAQARVTVIDRYKHETVENYMFNMVSGLDCITDLELSDHCLNRVEYYIATAGINTEHSIIIVEFDNDELSKYNGMRYCTALKNEECRNNYSDYLMQLGVDIRKMEQTMGRVYNQQIIDTGSSNCILRFC